MPTDWRMTTIDERFVRAPLRIVFALAADVQRWPVHLPHYRYVRFHERRGDGGGLVEMSANRPFGMANWPTQWTSLMSVDGPDSAVIPVIRFRHVRGVTRGMEVEWSFVDGVDGTHVRITHVWNGPEWPLIGDIAARGVIGPIFVHGIASRTLAGLGRLAERTAAGGENGGGATRIEVSSG
ncbi:MAG TPA: SRPBCC family protein [Gemmatimonadaceae bacterium]|jgi:ribosome-associated toxin RatA of RatAB toxin-antitoxin module|nr:SRPBCC family protein [Gemmatimonadaceae bacterium]